MYPLLDRGSHSLADKKTSGVGTSRGADLGGVRRIKLEEWRERDEARIRLLEIFNRDIVVNSKHVAEN